MVIILFIYFDSYLSSRYIELYILKFQKKKSKELKIKDFLERFEHKEFVTINKKIKAHDSMFMQINQCMLTSKSNFSF